MLSLNIILPTSLPWFIKNVRVEFIGTKLGVAAGQLDSGVDLLPHFYIDLLQLVSVGETDGDETEKCK